MQFMIAIVAGIMNMVQAGANSTLNEKLGANPVVPALVVYLGGILGVLVAAPFFDKPVSIALHNATLAPWWSWIGGLLGAVYVLTMLVVAKSMGAGPFTAVTVTAAVVTGLVLDHLGWVGFEVHTINVPRIAGGLLMVGGVALIARY